MNVDHEWIYFSLILLSKYLVRTMIDPSAVQMSSKIYIDAGLRLC